MRNRKPNGQFRSNSENNIRPLLVLTASFLVNMFIQKSFTSEEMISPYVSSNFNIRAYEIEQNEEIVIFHDSLPTPEPKVAKVTAYSCGGIKTEAQRQMNCPNGITATGTVPKFGTLACDRANLGRKFKLEGFNTVFTCEDRGGAINGSGRFDLYVETIQEAYQFGVQYLEYVEVK